MTPGHPITVEILSRLFRAFKVGKRHILRIALKLKKNKTFNVCL
jgi:hypothetical protein